MKLSFVAPVLMLACVTGCGGETGGTSGGDAGPKPTAAINMEIYATPDQDCPIGNVHVDIGNTKSVPPETVTDGQGGAAVTCKVAQTGSGLAASVSISKGNYVFSFDEVVSDGSSAIGHVRVEDPATGIAYDSTAAKPCVFQFAPGTDQGIQPGHVFIQFDCAELQKAEDPTKSCSSRYGYVYADTCEQ